MTTRVDITGRCIRNLVSWAVLGMLTTPIIIAQTADKQERPQYYILSVGINEYDDPYWQKLKWAENDARRFAEEVGEVETHQKSTKILLGKNAQLAAIRTAMNEILLKARPKDIVVFYFSMHGSLQPTRDGELDNVLVARDTENQNLATTSLTQNEIRRSLNQMRARRKLLIFASCHSGIGKSQIPESVRSRIPQTKGFIPQIEDVSQGVVVLSAAAQSEPAIESNQLRGDVYTHFFLKDAAAADRNGDGLVTALELHDGAARKTYEFTKQKQRPTVETSMIGHGDIPILGKKMRPGQPVLTAYESKFQGIELRLNDRAKGTTPIGAVLETGSNRLDLYFPGDQIKFARFDIEAKAGESISLSQVLAPPPYALYVGVLATKYTDSGVSRVFGPSAKLGYQLSALRRFEYFDWGLGLFGSNQLNDENLHGLKAKLNSQQISLLFGKTWNGLSWFKSTPLLSIGLNLGLGIEKLNFSLEGLDDRELSSSTSNRAILSLNALIQYQIFFASFSTHRSRHEFGDFGAIDGLRNEIGLGFVWEFGGPARIRWEIFE